MQHLLLVLRSFPSCSQTAPAAPAATAAAPTRRPRARKAGGTREDGTFSLTRTAVHIGEGREGLADVRHILRTAVVRDRINITESAKIQTSNSGRRPDPRYSGTVCSRPTTVSCIIILWGGLKSRIGCDSQPNYEVTRICGV